MPTAPQPILFHPSGVREANENSVDGHAAVDRENLSRRNLGLIGGQIDRHVGHMDRLPDP